MALKGEAKRDYQRHYMPKYMRGYRALGRDLSVKTPVKTLPVSRKDPVKTQIEGLVMDGNRIIGVSHTPVTKAPQVYVPGQRYQPGETVLVQRGRNTVEAVIPRLDADGNPMPEY